MTALDAPQPRTLLPARTALLDPEFDHARELLARDATDTRRAIATKCELAGEIVRLRGLNLKNQSHNLLVGPKAQVCRRGDGFQAKLASELGLHHEQASRLVEFADYIQRLRLAAAGKPVKYITGSGKDRHEETFEANDIAQHLAQDSLAKVLTGDTSPSRAWAGVVGEGTRRAETGKMDRAATNHYKNCEKAQAKWATSLEHYYEFTEEQRAYLDSTWEELLESGAIPERWLVEAAKALKEKGGRP